VTRKRKVEHSSNAPVSGFSFKSSKKRRIGVPADRSRDTRSFSPKQTQIPPGGQLPEEGNPYLANSRAAAREANRKGYFVNVISINEPASERKINIEGRDGQTHIDCDTVTLEIAPQHTNIADTGGDITDLKSDMQKAKQIIRRIRRIYATSQLQDATITNDIARELSSELSSLPRCPETADRLWDDIKDSYKDPISFARTEYAIFRHRGMLFADLLSIDRSLYKAFSNRCYYLGKTPRATFETIDDAERPSKASKAKAEGLLSSEIVKCPKKSEIGKTMTEQEYRARRRAYESQLQQVRRRERAATL
jgi:hypothetical protein